MALSQEAYALSKPKRNYAGKDYAGVERNQKHRMCGTRYEKTPILFELPLVGKKVRLLERIIAPEECKHNRVRYVEHLSTVYEVRGYTQGIENPLVTNNFLMAAYKTKAGNVLSQTFRTVDIALGIIKVLEVDEDEECVSTTKDNSTQAGDFIPSIT